MNEYFNVNIWYIFIDTSNIFCRISKTYEIKYLKSKYPADGTEDITGRGYSLSPPEPWSSNSCCSASRPQCHWPPACWLLDGSAPGVQSFFRCWDPQSPSSRNHIASKIFFIFLTKNIFTLNKTGYCQWCFQCYYQYCCYQWSLCCWRSRAPDIWRCRRTPWGNWSMAGLAGTSCLRWGFLLAHSHRRNTFPGIEIQI